MGFLNKIFKPVSKVLDKIIPNEIKPALPFAAAAFPFLAPELFASMGGLGGLITNPIAQRAVAGGITNLVSQASQEGAERRGINPMSFGIGTLGGALTAPSSEFGALKSIGTDAYGIGDAVRFNDIPSLGYADVMGGFDTTNIPLQGPVQLPADVTSNISSLDKIGNSVLGGAQTASDFFNKGVTALDQNGILDPTFLKAYAPGAIGAASDLAYNSAKDAQLKYQDQQAALGQTASANRQNQIDYIRKAMQTAGFTSPEIDDALKRSGFAYGGRAGYGMGGLMSLGGHEMDYRAAGGFVPIGQKERADDVPARLSKNEFVFTAKAVRNAGGGDIKEGAKRMYQIMRQLEAKA